MNPNGWDDGPDITKVAGIIAFFLLAIVGVYFGVRAERRKTAALNAERREKIRAAHEAGDHDKDGNPLCVVCGAIATRKTVRTGRPWFDLIPGLSTLNRLWGMPWRYSITDDEDDEDRLCSAHRRSAELKLDRVHSNWRARHAEFNASIQEESSMLDQGGLEQLLRDEHVKLRARFTPRARTDSATKLLTNGNDDDDEVQLLPVTTTDPEESQH